MDDDPIPTPKVKPARTEGNINQVMDIEMHHNDEEMYPYEWTEDFSGPDSEDEYIAGQAEGEGPPEVSQEKLQQLEQQAALDELEKLHQSKLQQRTLLIQPWSTTGDFVATSGSGDAEWWHVSSKHLQQMSTTSLRHQHSHQSE